LEIFEQKIGGYAKIILPMATPKPYTYHVPEELMEKVKFGVRVEVQFGIGRDLYSALVIELTDIKPDHPTKPILQVIDNEAIITVQQLKFWQWMASYYACTLGEIMAAALPTNLKLSSETRIILNPEHDQNFSQLDDKEYLVAEALTIQKELTIEQIQKILNQKTVYPIVNRLLMFGILELKEELHQKYKPKTATYIRLKEPYLSDTVPPSRDDDKSVKGYALAAAFDLAKSSEKQTNVLLAYAQISRNQSFIKASDIYEKAKVDISVLRALEKKGIFELYEKEVSRVGGYEDDISEATEMSDQQTKAIYEIGQNFKDKNVILLHGATGSGKTRVYVELIQKAIAQGQQVLYLLPEIALTTQITSRLQIIFGDNIAVYHSRLNGQERVELWQQTLLGKPVILGVRSSLFLPFKNLKYIIVDEEHDASFKQKDPNPRYNARDASIYLASLYGAKVLLGTATPSVETYHNTQTNKYGLVEMPKRFGGLQLPEIIIVDNKEEMKRRTLHGNFTSRLIEELKAALERGEQAILFQNRRGYAPTMACPTCGWTSECKNCDVNLTYHKFSNSLTCHYCGYTIRLPKECPACGHKSLNIKGFGTERIEDELKIYLPEAKIGRMDLDTSRSKNAHSKIINDFEEKRIEILVGTQMVTKGLDFENVGLVGVLSADNLLKFPDFRATERAFQLMMQVSGRAGRKHKRGKVIIQAFDIKHPILRDIVENEYGTFFKRELQERQNFQYPPYFRLIGVSLRHKKHEVLHAAAKVFTKYLREKLGNRVNGPAVPAVERVNTYFILDYLIKVEKDTEKIRFTKDTIAQAGFEMQNTEGYSNVRVAVDVDPY
jgi:primosomal protein N' (replication factor Y) (superfamily II helicase)